MEIVHSGAIKSQTTEQTLQVICQVETDDTGEMLWLTLSLSG